jgi:hypothetical protein
MTLVGRYGEALADLLRNVPGTELVSLYGCPRKKSPSRWIRTARCTWAERRRRSRAVQAADAKLRAGEVTGATDELVIEVTGEIDTLARLDGIVLREGPDGTTLRLGDMAEIAGAAPAGVRTGVAGRTSRGSGRGEAGGRVAGGRLGRGYPIRAGPVRDDAARGNECGAGVRPVDLYRRRLAEVGGNMALGVGLVVAVLFVTLGLRAALIVAVILPVVSLASLATMNAIGLPIHQMSVTGMIVALGLLVDAGIVMTDEIARRLRAGVPRARAVADSVGRLTMPLFASTATTALSFTPMILCRDPPATSSGPSRWPSSSCWPGPSSWRSPSRPPSPGGFCRPKGPVGRHRLGCDPGPSRHRCAGR